MTTLRRFRTQHLRIPQAEMAEAMGWRASYLCGLESGAEKLGRKSCLRLLSIYGRELKAAGITAEDLLRNEEDAA